MLRAYRWVFVKLLRRSVMRDVALLSDPAHSNSRSIITLNENYLVETILRSLDKSIHALRTRRWLMGVLTATLSLDVLALAFRGLRLFVFQGAGEIVLVAITLLSLATVLIAVSQMHHLMEGVLSPKPSPADTKLSTHSRNEDSSSELAVLQMNILCTLTIALIALTVVPHSPGTIILVPLTVVTIYLAAQRLTRMSVEAPLVGSALSEYLQRTSGLYPPGMMENVLFRQLEGTPVTLCWLVQQQKDSGVDSQAKGHSQKLIDGLNL